MRLKPCPNPNWTSTIYLWWGHLRIIPDWIILTNQYIYISPPKGSDPDICSYKPRGLAKSLQNKWMQANKLQNGRALCINQLFAAPLHFVGRYLFPRRLISIFFWVWVLLACLDPDPQKRHISLRFSQLSLRSNPPFLQGTGLSDICGLCFFNVDKKWSVHTPSIRVQIAGVHLCNRFIATILGAPIFELQNHVHNPKIASTKCNGFAWLLATNKSAFCSSIIFEPFKDRNAFCSGPFGVQNS